MGVMRRRPTYTNITKPSIDNVPFRNSSSAIKKMPIEASESRKARAGASNFATRWRRRFARTNPSIDDPNFFSSNASAPKDLDTRMLVNVSCKVVDKLALASNSRRVCFVIGFLRMRVSENWIPIMSIAPIVSHMLVLDR